MRKISKMLIMILMINMLLSLNAGAIWINDDIEENYITKGVTHTRIKRFTSNGWININYLKVDLNEPNLSLKVLSNKNSTKKSTVLDLAKNEENVVGAINADFFTSFTSTAAAEGMTIKDNELITNPSNDSSYATFFVDENNIPSISHFSFDIMVTSKRTNESSNVLFYNKNASPMYMKIYDKNFGGKTPGSHDDGYEVVVEDGVVTKVLSNEDGVDIPENGYVLHNSLRYSLFLSENFNVGDEVELKISISPSIENIKEAVGGGTVLVENGKKAQFTLKDVRQPMTALGIDKTGKILYFFTVDGRSDKSIGMTFSEISDFLINLGCYSGMSFDGGGSTTLVAKNPCEDIKNINMQSSYRQVINALGVTSEKPKGSFYKMKLGVSKKDLFVGQGTEIKILSSFDEYGNEYKVSDISYSSDKLGIFKGNVYYPSEEGEATITVTADKISEKITVNVYDNATVLESDIEKFKLTSSPQDITLTARNSEGYGGKVELSDVNVSFSGCSGYVSYDKIVLKDVKEGEITFTYKNAKITIPVGDREIKNEINDRFYKTTVDGGYLYTVMPSYEGSNTLFSKIMTDKIVKKANTSNLTAFKSVPENVSVQSVRVTNYGREDTRDALFLKLDNEAGSLKNSKPAQWEWLLNVFKKGVYQKNVFINMPLDFDKMNDEDEKELFLRILKDNLKDKNIFIITFGDRNKYEVRDGIRYIKIANIPTFTKENGKNIVNNSTYGEFKIIGQDVFFSYKPII